ncbi:DsbA family protein [Streptacidiphilus monticola]|uniref:DsbA family protein n=1 Tax=Streptacidiphilus monticola TaxID=2161674 RepID=A0ABW1GDI7_9ACTN
MPTCRTRATRAAHAARAALAALALSGALLADPVVDHALAEAVPAPAVASFGAPLVRDVPDRGTALPLPAALDRDRAAIDVGYRGAPVVLTVFEDYRCDSTGAFERIQGPTLRSLAAAHKVLIRYVLESSLDERLPGPGALWATNAARAALAHGGFPLYHALLFANQPDERADGFTEQRLLQLASQVPKLRGKAFDSEVHRLAWRDWVARAQHAYDTAGVHHGTPSILVNGREVDLWAQPRLLDSPAYLRSFVEKAAQKH